MVIKFGLLRIVWEEQGYRLFVGSMLKWIYFTDRFIGNVKLVYGIRKHLF